MTVQYHDSDLDKKPYIVCIPPGILSEFSLSCRSAYYGKTIDCYNISEHKQLRPQIPYLLLPTLHMLR